MRLLRLIHTVDPATGGPAQTVRLTSEILTGLGHTVEIASLDPAGAASVRDYPLPLHPLGARAGGYGYSPALVPWLRENAARFDAVLVHGLWQYHGFAAWRALHGGPVPYFVFTHGMLDPWFRRTYPLKHVKKLCYWPWAERRVLRDARAVLFTTTEERRLARQSFRSYRARERVVTYGTLDPGPATDARRSAFLEQQPTLRDTRIALYLGRIHEKKGVDLLLRAWPQAAQRDPRLRLVVAGPCADAAYLDGLKTLARECGAESTVVWTGMLEGAAKWGAFDVAEAFVLPSHQENFGVSAAESLACSVPALVSDQVNIWREIVADGAGYAAPDTQAGVEALLARWLETPPAEWQAMRARARACFLRRYEIHAAVRSLLDCLREP